MACDAASQNGEWYAAYEQVQSETPECSFGREELQHLIRFELRRIPIFLRTPLEMHYLQDRSLEEIACFLGVTVAAAKSRLHRAHTYLKNRMLRHCGSRGPATLIQPL